MRLPSTLDPSVFLLLHSMRLSPLGMVVRRSPTWSLASAADAWATGSKGGIGGWWQRTASEDPNSFGWFSLQFDVGDFEDHLGLPEHLQNAISSLELFAQLVLLV